MEQQGTMCFAYSERQHGADLAASDTVAQRTADGFEITGEKWPINSATVGGLCFCDHGSIGEISAPVCSFIEGGTIDAAGGEDSIATDRAGFPASPLGSFLSSGTGATAGSVSANIIEQHSCG